MNKSLLLVAWLLAAGTTAAQAQTCASLAERYAKSAESLSDVELGRLRTCVTNTLNSKSKSPSGVPPAAVPLPPPPPAPPPPVLPASPLKELQSAVPALPPSALPAQKK